MPTLIRLALVVTLSCICILAQGKPPKGDADVSVTSILDGPAGVFRISGDGFGAYQNNLDGTESIIQGIGDWVLNTRLSAARSVYIDFGDPISPSEPAAPFAFANRPARMISKCAQVGFKIRDMQVGQTRTCPLAVAFDHGGINYRIAFNDNNFSTTDWVQWTCLASANGRCASWMMEPAAVYGDARKSIGQLIKLATSRKNPEQALGRFYFSFRVYVTHP